MMNFIEKSEILESQPKGGVSGGFAWSGLYGVITLRRKSFGRTSYYESKLLRRSMEGNGPGQANGYARINEL